ncbi:hypothetical protein MTR_1g041820 [Medicago truncatula]|uniref:Uncharacterized protein n=1 Tax=Medicago truncatula TaxID=3880 RepID=G7I3P2_MEDTR|nr:hypothetical protein MTR_1g041820 [Medicago truncatula]
MGLETPVVHLAPNNGYQAAVRIDPCNVIANALSIPPGEYIRKKVHVIDLPLHGRSEGWGMFVLKEKFKMIKGRLKDWRRSHTKHRKQNKRSKGRIEQIGN